jgi:predicted TIM-barrel fold metal-dependent hydrolase
MGLPALVFVRLWDERSHHWRMQVPPLAVDDLAYVLKTYPELRVAVCNANLPIEGAALAPVLPDRAQTLLTTAYKSLKLAEMVARVGADRIAYGSGMPFTYPESALLQVRDAEIDERSRARILGQNAAAFLGEKAGTFTAKAPRRQGPQRAEGGYGRFC